MKPVLPYVLLSLWFLTSLQAEQQLASDTPQTLLLPMRDGVRLATDIYKPAVSAPYPAILIRTPYGKSKSVDSGRSAAKLGYAVVIQDTRGRFASEGDNLPFNVDNLDGFDTVAWLMKQGWCNGKIGTYGGSALGITQLQLAGSGAPGIACQYIVVGAANLYSDVVYTGGVFRKSLVEDWLRASQFSPRALELWAGHSSYDRYWLARDASREFSKANYPALHVGGFYDIFAQATIESFLGYQTKGGPGARGQQKLLMGPWTHAVLTEKSGELVFPKADRPPNNVQDQTRWWERYLKGVLNGVDALPAVTYYVMGDTSDPSAPGNVWRTADQWPPVATHAVRWYLSGDQSLAPTPPRTGNTITYIYDPKSPVPTVGGYQLTIPAGPRDQRSIEDRADLVAFTSAPLPSPLEVTGQARVKLYVSTDVPDTDFLARLCDVYPDGRSINICEGIIRARHRHSLSQEDFLKTGKTYPLEIKLWPTSIIFNRGHRLRVHITSSSAPGYEPNLNTDEPMRWSDRSTVAHNTLHVSGSCPSFVELPVASATKAAVDPTP